MTSFFTGENRRGQAEKQRKARQILGLDDTTTVSRSPSHKKKQSQSLMMKEIVQVAPSGSMRIESPALDRHSDVAFPNFKNLDSLFSGKVYEPRPAVQSDPYEGGTCKAVPISEVATTEMTEDSRHWTHNTSHESQAFYHRELTREAAMILFHRYGSQPGLCVVRDSKRTPGHYTLTVWEGKTAINYKIEFCVRNGNGFYLLSGKTPFKSIGDILLFLYRNSEYFPVAPTMYIPYTPDVGPYLPDARA